MTLLHRYGSTDTWEIMRAAVLPGHRRRGIGRQMVEASLDFIRSRGGRVIVLYVIAGNVPACRLYEQSGFEVFEKKISFDYKQDELPPKIPCPDGYAVSPIDSSDWRCEYEFALRTVPSSVQKYLPVREENFRLTPAGRLAAHIARRAGSVRKESIAVRTSLDGHVVAVAGYSARTQPGGVNGISIRIDPARAEIAPYLLHDLIRATQGLSPGRRIGFTVPHWQSTVIEAANAAGCVKHLEYHGMGITL
jgi:predicted GNAT family acetyltransferase